MAIELEKETRDALVASIKRYFNENLDDEIGDLKASLFLDYCLEEIGPSIYNQAISDAETLMTRKVADLQDECWEPPLEYWKEKRG